MQNDPDAASDVCHQEGSPRGRHGGSKKFIESMMKSRVATYLNSYPSRGSLAPNHEVHSLARKCSEGQCSFEDLDRLARILDYREKAMKVAVALVQVLRLEPFTPHWKWDMHEWQSKPEVAERLKPTRSALRLVLEARLIPSPGKDESHPWPKPVRYLCAALIAHTQNDDQVATKIKEGQDWLEEQISLKTKQVTLSLTTRGRKNT